MFEWRPQLACFVLPVGMARLAQMQGRGLCIPRKLPTGCGILMSLALKVMNEQDPVGSIFIPGFRRLGL